MGLSRYNLIRLPEIDSTNDFLKQNHALLPDKTLVQAAFQKRGRGQFDRSWEAEANQNLLVSLLVKNQDKLELQATTVASSLVALLKRHDVEAQVKSPNDILVNGRKIAGILIERIFDGNILEATIIGVGLNVNQVDFPALNATSLKLETDSDFVIDEILTEWIECLETCD